MGTSLHNTLQVKSMAQEAIDRCTENAYASLKMAERLADDYKLTFNFPTSYGIGGRYVGGCRGRTVEVTV